MGQLRQYALRRLLYAGRDPRHRGVCGRPRHYGDPRDRPAGPYAFGADRLPRVGVYGRPVRGVGSLGRGRRRAVPRAGEDFRIPGGRAGRGGRPVPVGADPYRRRRVPEGALGEMPPLPGAYPPVGAQGQGRLYGRTLPAGVRDRPHREIPGRTRPAHHRLGRDTRRTGAVGRHRHVVARQRGRHQGREARPRRDHDSQFAFLFRLLPVARRRCRTLRNRGLRDHRQSLFVRPDGRSDTRAAGAYPRRAGKPLDGVHRF